MKTYLETHGLSSDRILTEDQSTNTRENLIFSAELIPDGATVGIITNGSMSAAPFTWQMLLATSMLMASPQKET